MRRSLLFATTILSCLSCTSCTPNRAYWKRGQPRQMTLGQAQREIYQGMSQDEVAFVLGSPNIVTKDKEGNEAWIYDKVASEAHSSKTCKGAWLVIFGGESSSSCCTATQRTLTLIIKFDEEQCVDKVTYHSSKF